MATVSILIVILWSCFLLIFFSFFSVTATVYLGRCQFNAKFWDKLFNKCIINVTNLVNFDYGKQNNELITSTLCHQLAKQIQMI